MTKEFCDICGEEIAPQDDSSYFKLKELKFCFDEAWWEKLHVHTECWKDMCEYINSLRISRAQEKK